MHLKLQHKYTGWPKSFDPNIQVYCGLIINAVDLILAEMLPFVSCTRILPK